MDTKKCKTCGVVKSWDDFYKNKYREYRPLAHCKVCQNEKINARRKRLDLKSTDQVRAWRKAHPEQNKLGGKKWADANRETVRKSGREWARRNRDKCYAYTRARREKNKKPVMPLGPTKKCFRCNTESPRSADFFDKSAGQRDGLSPYCKPCQRARSREWQQANYQRHREYMRAAGKTWRDNNPERVREVRTQWHKLNKDKLVSYSLNRRARALAAPGSHTTEQIRALYAKQKECCAYCKVKLNGAYHRDHYIALSNRGSNDITNIQLLCGSCNLKKNARDPIEFAQSIGLLL